jgi:hypothetical protein
MAFMNNNNGFNQNNNGEPQKRTNFKVDKIRKADGELTIGIWDSDRGGTFTSISIKAAIGPNPATGGMQYEMTKPNELPSILLTKEWVKALITAMEQSKPEDANLVIQPGKDKTKMTIAGTPTSFTIELNNAKTGTRKMTFDAIPVGPQNIHAAWMILLEDLRTCYKATSYGKLDKERFGTTPLEASDDTEENPF